MLHKRKRLVKIFWQHSPAPGRQAGRQEWAFKPKVDSVIALRYSKRNRLCIFLAPPNQITFRSEPNSTRPQLNSDCARKRKQKTKRKSERSSYLSLQYQLLGEHHGLFAEGLGHLHPSGRVPGAAGTLDTCPRRQGARVNKPVKMFWQQGRMRYDRV